MKKGWIAAIVALVVVLAGVIAYLGFGLHQAQQDKQEMEELMALDKQEMENEYKSFTQQYDELKNTIQNDTLTQQLNAERQRAQQLLEELQRVKATDAREITRLRKELADVRRVMRHYLMQIDSLQRINNELMAENTEVKEKYTAATTQISNLNTEKEQLKETVSIASQLNATALNVQPLTKKGRAAKKVKDVTQLAVSFTIARNPTAKTGGRNAYVRILKPDNSPLTKGETCNYENKKLEVSFKKYIEYGGEELNVQGYYDVDEYLAPGTYRIFVFVDDRMIGQSTFTLK